MNWGKELRSFRQRTGLKQEAAAHLLGVSQAYVSRLENATATPSANLEAKLARLLKEPEHRPMFEHFRATVSLSPHLTSLITESQGQIIVDAVSSPLMEFGPPFHDVELGAPVNEDIGDEANQILSDMLHIGAFAGQVASLQVVWSYEGDATPITHWRSTHIPVRNDAGRWYLHGTHTEISADEKAQCIECWEGPMKVRSFEEPGSDQAQPAVENA